jgi:hypothetical protein
MTFGLPLLPLRGLLAVASLLQEEAERELLDPSRVRRRLEEVEAAEAANVIPDEVATQAKQEALSHLVSGRRGETDAGSLADTR